MSLSHLSRVFVSRARPFAAREASVTTKRPTHHQHQLLIRSQPPLPVRAALVATTTAIGTPAFPVVGFINIMFRLIPDKSTRIALTGTTSVVGAAWIVLTSAGQDLLPVVYSYSQFFIPFAVSNGIVACGAYSALDLVFGTSALVKNPFAGAGIGALVGLLAPHMYDEAFEYFYGINVEGFWSMIFSNPFSRSISTSTGAAVGFILHPLLYYPMKGVEGMPWTRFSAPILMGGFAILGYLYYLPYDAPQNSYLDETQKKNLELVPRFDATTLKAKDWERKAGFNDFRQGRLTRQELREVIDTTGNPVFYTKRSAWVYNVTNTAVALENHIVTIQPEKDLIRKAQKLLLGDGIVGFLVAENHEKMREALIEVTNEVQERSFWDTNGDAVLARALKSVDNIELASVGVALLMKMKRDGIDNKLKQKLENDIRKMVPEIILFRQEEQGGFEGCSVEAQLDHIGWKGADEASERKLNRKWSSIVRKVENEEQRKKLLRTIIGGVGLTIGLFAVMESLL